MRAEWEIPFIPKFSFISWFWIILSKRGYLEIESKICDSIATNVMNLKSKQSLNKKINYRRRDYFQINFNYKC